SKRLVLSRTLQKAKVGDCYHANTLLCVILMSQSRNLSLANTKENMETRAKKKAATTTKKKTTQEEILEDIAKQYRHKREEDGKHLRSKEVNECTRFNP